jgi:mono/diheme cytochrome c family protein
MSKAWCSVTLVGVFAIACGDPAPTDQGAGAGGAASGGTSPAGGAVGTGGVGGPGSGGAVFGSGGAVGTGGVTPGTGGTLPGTGGAAPGSGGGTGGGQATVYSMACARCHGVNAEGVEDNEGATGHGPPIVRATHEILTWIVRAGDQNETMNNMGMVVGDPAEMDAFGADILPDSEVAIIEEFLHSFPKPTTGAALFAENCAYCHGDDGKGGETEYASAFHSAPFMSKNLSTFTTFVQQGHTTEGAMSIGPEDRREYMPPFQDVLTPEEISLIWDWASAQ